jgi:hypothetical protein
MEFRVFAFDRISEERERTKCMVRADLALARKYGIRIQELPLLCRSLLERKEAGEEIGSLTFTEAEMQECARLGAAAHDAAARKRKPPHRPAGDNVGTAWRGRQPVVGTKA